MLFCKAGAIFLKFCHNQSMRKSLSFILSFLLCIFLTSMSPAAETLSPQFDFVRYGNNILAGISISIPNDYHAYAHRPGKIGLPTKLDFTLEGEGEMPVLYPQGKLVKDVFDPAKEVFIYEGKIYLLALLPSGSTEKLYAAHLEMLLCSNRHCKPFKQSYTGNIPKIIPLLADVPWAKDARDILSREGESSGALSLEEGAPPPPKTISPSQSTTMGNELEKGENDLFKAGIGRAEVNGTKELVLTPQYADSELEIYGLAQALLLGLLAGLLLNAMPCVLPVLTMKVSGLLLMGNLKDKTSIRRFREHNICFAAGILTLFTVLAFLLGAADLMWGQLYQNQAVLLIMLLLVFLMGLSMLGVFTLPAFDLHMGSSTHPMLNSYLTGLVSTFLATPCSGPLLGGVLAWAFTQTITVLLSIFWAVGLGMALPYIIFCIWPSLVKILPRPGNWMYVFEHILGFLLLGTALYLLSILPASKHMQILAVLLLVSLCAWLWGKFCGLEAPRLRRRLVGSLGCLLLAGAIVWILQPPAQGLEWQTMTKESFEQDFGKKNMLVEFTADWCPNCKFLEATVLSSAQMRAWQKKYGLELVKVDLTHPDEFADKLLNMLGSKSIPLTAIFPRGENASRPLVLRDLYVSSALEDALSKALGRSLRAHN